MTALLPSDYEMFARFGVSPELLEAAHVERVSDEEARNDYGITGNGDMSGIAFLYFVPSSNGHRVTCRVRRDHPEIEVGKPKRKYVAPFGDVRHLYFPPDATALLKDLDTELVFVESEKAQLALTAWAERNDRKVLAIATGGCWGWRGTIGKTVDADGARVDEVGPLPDLQCVENRKCTILFDSNTATNPKVESARFAFANTLRKLKAASVATPNLPTRGNPNVNGPDDYLAEFGDVAMTEVLNSRQSTIEIFETFAQWEDTGKMQFAIEGFLQAEGATFIGGLSGHGKTFLMLSMVKALLAGEGTKLWNLFEVQETAASVLYLIPECGRASFKHRLKMMNLYDYLFNNRLLVRTLSMGPAPDLKDPRILAAAKRAHVFLDTATRFADGDENASGDNQKGLASDLFSLLQAEARTVTGAHHSPKSFAKDNTMTLENVLRGSGDIGAMISTGWGVKQLDKTLNIVHVECVKARDFVGCEPFQLQLRPHLDQTGDVFLLKRPGECGSLDEEQFMPNQANDKRHQNASDRVDIVRKWLKDDPNETVPEQVAKFKAMGIEATDQSMKRYRALARKDSQ